MWRVGATYGYSATHLVFDTSGDPGLGGTTTVPMRKQAVSALAERRIGDRWSVQLSGGAVLTGELDVAGEKSTILPGPFASVAGSFRALDEKKWTPFVLVSASFGASVTWTKEEGVASPRQETMAAFDARVGVAVGKTIGGIFSPYLAARAFGLPVLWTIEDHASVGTDAYHFQLGVGGAGRRGGGVGVVGGIPLGEQAIVAGGGYSF